MYQLRHSADARFSALCVLIGGALMSVNVTVWVWALGVWLGLWGKP